MVPFLRSRKVPSLMSRSSFGLSRSVLLLLLLFSASLAQACQWYTITVSDGATATEVSWSLMDQDGVVWASGGAPYEADICLPDGCYTLLMYDSGGNGWQNEDWFIEDWIGEFDWDTNLPNGPHGSDGFVLGNGQPCDPVNQTGCPPDALTLQFIVTGGTAPAQVGWNVAQNGAVIAAGGAPYNDTLCLAPGCYVLHLNDAASNGWNGASYTLKYFGGATLYTGTLSAGGADSVLWSIGGVTGCTWPDPGGPGGPGGSGGGSCSNTGDPTGDCPTVTCVCDPFTFPITPSSFGNWNEVPSPGSMPSNPAFGGVFNPPPWGGTDYGCLLAGELNSSWMMFTVGASGSLGFSFGAGGQQVGYYDWAMWPYTGPGTCSAISSGTLPPVRCVWNAVYWGGTGLANTIPPGGDAGNYGPQLAVAAGQQFIICFSNWSYVDAEVTLDFFGTATVACSPTPLPIELLLFDAEADGDHVHTLWETASEHLSDHFEVERSADEVQWTTIGQLPAAGESMNLLHYQLDDAHPMPGWNYYRLREVDQDGTVAVSDVRAIHYLPPMTDGGVYPQPNTGQFMVMAPLRQPLLFAANGQRVEVSCVLDQEGAWTRCTIKDASPGVYFLVDAQGSQRYRILVGAATIP